MFMLSPLGAGNFYDAYNSTYRIEFQGRQLPEPTFNPMTTVYKDRPKLLKPVAASDFPPNYPYKSDNPAAVEKLREEYNESARESTAFTSYVDDYEEKPEEEKRFAWVPAVRSKDYYNPKYDLRPVEREAYLRKNQIDYTLIAVSQKSPRQPCRGMSPMMFPDGTPNKDMNIRSTYQADYLDNAQFEVETCRQLNNQHFPKVSRNKLKEIKESENYIPVPLQPLNQLTVL